jgi:hypothetical protein
MTMSIETRKPLSAKALENLAKNEEIRNRGSKFVKLDSGQKITLLFDPEQIKSVEVEFDGKKTTRFEYIVHDPNTSGLDNQGRSINQEKTITVSKRTSAAIDLYLKDGFNQLVIHRIGSGKETNYMVSAG